MKVLIAAFMLALLPLSVHAQVYAFPTSSQKGGRVVDLDSRSPSPSGNVRAWLITIFEEPVDGGDPEGRLARFAKSYEEFDCRDRRLRTLQASAFTTDFTLITQYQSQPDPWSFVEPESVGWATLELVCDIRVPVSAVLFENRTATEVAVMMRQYGDRDDQ